MSGWRFVNVDGQARTPNCLAASRNPKLARSFEYADSSLFCRENCQVNYPYEMGCLKLAVVLPLAMLLVY